MKQRSTLIIRVNLQGEESEMSVEDPDEILPFSSDSAFLRELLPEYDINQSVIDDLFRKIAFYCH